MGVMLQCWWQSLKAVKLTPELRIMKILTHLLFIALVFMIACTEAVTNRYQSVITEHIHIKK